MRFRLGFAAKEVALTIGDPRRARPFRLSPRPPIRWKVTRGGVALLFARPASGGDSSYALLRFYGHKMVMFGWQVHFIGVGVSALVAAIAAIALTVVGVRRNDGRAVLVGTAFTVMAALLAIHGLATPGVLIGMNGVIALTGAATLPVGAAVLALSALPSLRRPTNLHALLLLDALAVAVVIALGVV